MRSARAAGGERPDGGDPRILARQGKRLGPPQSDALKASFREAVDRLPAYRRSPRRPPSDVITKGFDIGYLTGGPINPSDYLAHNHRVLFTW